MSGPLRRCTRPGCRLCSNPLPTPDHHETLAELFLGGAALVLLFIVLFVLLPVAS